MSCKRLQHYNSSVICNNLLSFYLRFNTTFSSSRSYIEHQVCKLTAFFDLTVTNGLPPLSPREECTIFTVNGQYTYWPARHFQILIMIYTCDRLLRRPAKIILKRNGDCCSWSPEGPIRGKCVASWYAYMYIGKATRIATVINLLQMSFFFALIIHCWKVITLKMLRKRKRSWGCLLRPSLISDMSYFTIYTFIMQHCYMSELDVQNECSNIIGIHQTSIRYNQTYL